MFRKYVLRNRSLLAWIGGAATLHGANCDVGGVLDTLWFTARIVDVWV
jgi:hypothetical protein